MRLSLRLPAPSSPRPFAAVCSLTACLLTACLLLLPPPARAGTYVWTQTDGSGNVTHSPTYSGGKFVCSFLSEDYRPLGNPATAYGNPDDKGGQVDCSGEIDTVYTWQPAPGQTMTTDPPPASVVVQEDCTAKTNGSSGSSVPVTGVCDTGLGVSLPPSQLQGATIPLGIQCSATRYKVMAGGPTVKLACSPRAQCSGLYAQCEVRYTPAIFPVTVSLGGTTKDSSGNQNILIGQRCQGSLSAGPASLSNYQWVVPGQVFGKFNVATDQSWAYASNLFTDPDWIKATPQWCWSKDETQTVSCTAQASINGQVIGTVTGQQQVTIWAPYYYFGNDTGGVFINPYSAASWTLQATAITNVSIRGTNWQGRVSTPPLFSTGASGAWNFVQIITPGRFKTLTSGGSMDCTENGNTGLDTSYPYPAGQDASGHTSDPFLALLNGWSADDTLHQTGDSPSTWLDDTISNENVDENFQVYMMYLPPGSSSQWVPLHQFQWRWYASDSIPGVSWTSWVPGTFAGYVARSSSQRCTTHPAWQRLEGVSVGSGW